MTKTVKIGNRIIGGGNPILIQSMTNTKTENVEATAAQINQLTAAGCDIIRCAVPTMDAAKALKEIKKQVQIPVVADIHFDYRLAIAAMENGADKIRINPGNIGSAERVKAVVDVAKERNIPIRVGVNSGSLEKNLVEKYHGVTAEGLVESALDKVKLIEDMGYDNDICGYARISLAYAAGEPTDARRMPQPDFLLCCNNICNMMTKWYENIARMHNIPLIMIDIPFSNTVDTPEEKVDYLIGQFDYAIKQLEELTGKKFDEKKFAKSIWKEGHESGYTEGHDSGYTEGRESILGILDAINRGNDTVEKLTALGYDAKTAQEVLEKK